MLGAALGAYGDHAEARRTSSGPDRARRAQGRPAEARSRPTASWASSSTGWATAPRPGCTSSARSRSRDEVKSVGSRVLTLSAMGNAALAEGDAARASAALAEALPDARSGAGAMAALVLCRLARAHRAAGRTDEAQASAREALAARGGGRRVPRGTGDLRTLAEFLTERREEFLARARAMPRTARGTSATRWSGSGSWSGIARGDAPADDVRLRPTSS